MSCFRFYLILSFSFFLLLLHCLPLKDYLQTDLRQSKCSWLCLLLINLPQEDHIVLPVPVALAQMYPLNSLVQDQVSKLILVVASNMQRMINVCFMKARKWENRGSRDRKRLTSLVEG